MKSIPVDWAVGLHRNRGEFTLWWQSSILDHLVRCCQLGCSACLARRCLLLLLLCKIWAYAIMIVITIAIKWYNSLLPFCKLAVKFVNCSLKKFYRYFPFQKIRGHNSSDPQHEFLCQFQSCQRLSFSQSTMLPTRLRSVDRKAHAQDGDGSHAFFRICFLFTSCWYYYIRSDNYYSWRRSL